MLPEEELSYPGVSSRSYGASPIIEPLIWRLRLKETFKAEFKTSKTSLQTRTRLTKNAYPQLQWASILGCRREESRQHPASVELRSDR